MFQFHGNTLTALRIEEFNYQTSGEREELFELSDDQEEVSGSHPEGAQSLTPRLNAWAKEFGRPVVEGGRGEFSAAVEQQLRKLGYTD